MFHREWFIVVLPKACLSSVVPPSPDVNPKYAYVLTYPQNNQKILLKGTLAEYPPCSAKKKQKKKKKKK